MPDTKKKEQSTPQNDYPFRRATPDNPKSVDEMLRDASIVASVAELRDVEKKLGKEQTQKQYLKLMKQVNDGKLTIADIEQKRIKHQKKRSKKKASKTSKTPATK